MNYKALLASLLLIIMPLKPVVLVVLALTVVDLVTGITAALKRKEPITSSGLKRTIMKLFVYETVVVLSFFTEQYLTGDMLPLVKILSGYIGITEMKSCLENLEDITGVPVLAALIEKLSQAGK